jgi:hypothetical protein
MYDWIGANWISLLLGIGLVWFLFRRGGMGCGMGGHSHGSEPAREDEADPHGEHAAQTGASHEQGGGAAGAPRRHGCC